MGTDGRGSVGGEAMATVIAGGMLAGVCGILLAMPLKHLRTRTL